MARGRSGGDGAEPDRHKGQPGPIVPNVLRQKPCAVPKVLCQNARSERPIRTPDQNARSGPRSGQAQLRARLLAQFINWLELPALLDVPERPAITRLAALHMGTDLVD